MIGVTNGPLRTAPADGHCHGVQNQPGAQMGAIARPTPLRLQASRMTAK